MNCFQNLFWCSHVYFISLGQITLKSQPKTAFSVLQHNPVKVFIAHISI